MGVLFPELTFHWTCEMTEINTLICNSRNNSHFSLFYHQQSAEINDQPLDLTLGSNLMTARPPSEI